MEIKKKYNPLQMISYCLAFVLIVFEIISGLALKYPDSSAIRWSNYGFFNNEIEARMARFVVTWLFIMFLMIHVYLTIREKFAEINVGAAWLQSRGVFPGNLSAATRLEHRFIPGSTACGD